MGRIEKTVFISYRRTNVPWALAICQNLTHHGYDVFFDFNGIASGDFEQIILENIRARDHFVVLLTASALDRCAEAGDWLRREIETALDTRRNIVPIMLEGFDFATPGIANQLTGTLAPLRKYNALRIPSEYFEEAMERLRTKWLHVALDGVPHPASLSARNGARDQQAAVATAPLVRETELSAQEWFERAFYASDLDEKVSLYSEAIRLEPDFAEAFNNRGAARRLMGDLDGALRDYSAALRFKPDSADAFNNRGNVRKLKGDLDGALRDYNEALGLKPVLAETFSNRGTVRKAMGDLDGALRDYNQAMRLKPDLAEALNNRGIVRQAKGDLEGALQDYNDAIRLKPDYVDAFESRGSLRQAKGDLEGAQQDYDEANRLREKRLK